MLWLAGGILILRHADQRTFRAISHARRDQAVEQALCAAIALGHFAAVVIGWRGDRARHFTAVTADAVGVVVYGKPHFTLLGR